MTLPLIIALAPLPILAVVVAILLFARGGETLPADALRVPLTAAFGSLKGLGPFAGTHNNLSPLLLLRPDTIEYRVLRRTTALYSAVASVDVSPGRRSSDIVLVFGDGYRFTGRTRDTPALAAALRQLRAKGCTLSAEAGRVRRRHLALVSWPASKAGLPA